MAELPGSRAAERMLAALGEGDRARLKSPPNPWVGAVLETPGGKLFFGHTQGVGLNHAEAEVLAEAGDAAAGSTLYVTLEPCAHYGRTPPCAQRIVSAGICKVVVGITDPDERVSGKGLAYLREHGVEVVLGVEKERVKRQLAPYLKHRSTGMPWVILKMAVTLDGRIAASDGSSKWITGPEARKRVHELRAMSDVIVVGANTAGIDDPRLDVRLPGVDRNPLRVVFGKLRDGARMSPAEEFSGMPSDFLAWVSRERDVLQVMVEGGSQLAKSFLDSGSVDEFIYHIAPAIHGGSDGVPVFAGIGAGTAADFVRLDLKETNRFGEDIEVVAWSRRASELISAAGEDLA